MTSSSDLNTIAGRLASFDGPHQVAKRRASSTKKKTITQASWPHKTPKPEDVGILLQLLSTVQKLTRFSLHELGSTTNLPPTATTASHVIFVRRCWMGGTPMTNLPLSTCLMYRIVVGQSMCALNSAIKIWIGWKRIHLVTR